MRRAALLAIGCLMFGATHALEPASSTPGAQATAPLLWSAHPGPEPSYINSVSLSRDGQRILAGTFHNDYSRPPDADDTPPLGRYGTFLFDRRGKLLWKDEFTGQHGVYDTALSSSGRWAASSGWFSRTQKAGFVAIYAAGNGRKLVDFRGAPGRVSSVAFSNNEQLVAAGSDAVYLFRRVGRGFARQPERVELPAVANSDARPNKITAVVVSGDGKHVVAGNIKGQVVLIEVQPTAATVRAQFRTDGPVRNVAMASGADFVVVGAGAGRVYGFDLEHLVAGEPNWAQQFDGARAIFGVAITDDAQSVAAVANIGDRGEVGVIDNASRAGTWRWRSALARNPNGVARRVAVADGFPNGKPGAFSIFAGDNGALLWSYSSGDMSWPVELSADGRTCAAGSDDGRVYAFALDRPEAVAQ